MGLRVALDVRETSASRVGVADMHFTPGVPFNPRLTRKAFSSLHC
jgi:hypothetical protein